MASADRLVWIDCEMTGLDPQVEEVVEIACIVTEADLTPIDEGISIVIRPSQESFDRMEEVVVNMHTESGLIGEIADGTTLEDAQERVLEYVRRHVPESRKAPLAGSSVYVDRSFLAKYMPELDQHLHYRLVDVSSVKEMVRRWYPRAYFATPKKVGNHRAMGDTLDSIAELRFYREAVFVPQPGPDTETAQALGQSHTVEVEGVVQ